MLYHHGIASPLSGLFLHLPCRRALVYHNITPARLYEGTPLWEPLMSGRAQVAAMAAFCELAIGVSRVTGPDELARAVDEAFEYDDVVLVEQGITGRELLCGVIGDADEAEASLPSELKVDSGFADYAHKYLGEKTTITSPADVPDDVTERVREISLRAFHAIGGYGLARVDFLYDETAGQLYVGEINTMPGFTARSFFARGWAASGLPYEQVLDRLLGLALTRHARRRGRGRRSESVGEAVR